MSVLSAMHVMTLFTTGCGQVATAPQCNPSCSSGQTCVQNASTGKTSCQTAGATSCTSDNQCLNGQKCQSGVCAVAQTCATDSQCLNGQKCQSGVCVASSSGCTSDSQCATGQKCQGGACATTQSTCTADNQCLNGQKCQNGSCVTSSFGCTSDTQCANGQKCQSGSCVTSGSPATASCGEIVNCIQPCSTNACAQACLDKGTATARQQYDAVISCGDAHNCKDSTCINTNCQPEIAVCRGTSTTTGPQTCMDLNTCIGKCGDSNCEQACYSNAPASAQQAYSALLNCYTQNGCKDSACLQSKCAPELSACANGTSATGPTTCAELNSCITKCNGDATCAQNCVSSATPKAQQDSQALRTCVQGHNCGTTASCWKQYCSSEAAACGLSL